MKILFHDMPGCHQVPLCGHPEARTNKAHVSALQVHSKDRSDSREEVRSVARLRILSEVHDANSPRLTAAYCKNCAWTEAVTLPKHNTGQLASRFLHNRIHR